jgi:hypothetical protein
MFAMARIPQQGFFAKRYHCFNPEWIRPIQSVGILDPAKEKPFPYLGYSAHKNLLMLFSKIGDGAIAGRSLAISSRPESTFLQPTICIHPAAMIGE